jgi:hypothetical protein
MRPLFSPHLSDPAKGVKGIYCIYHIQNMVSNIYELILKFYLIEIHGGNYISEFNKRPSKTHHFMAHILFLTKVNLENEGDLYSAYSNPTSGPKLWLRHKQILIVFQHFLFHLYVLIDHENEISKYHHFQKGKIYNFEKYSLFKIIYTWCTTPHAVYISNHLQVATRSKS